MTKSITVFVSVILILACVIIEILMKDNNTTLDEELVGFFAGVLFGTGIGLLIHAFFRKKETNR